MAVGGERVESARLVLRVLDDREMAALVEGESDAGLKQAYAEMLEGCRREPEKRVWHAVWVMELKGGKGEAVGNLSFKGLGEDGMVEVGYGLNEGWCGKGYMTEAVRTMAEWALAQPEVTRVEAETEAANGASRRVLERAGFVPTGTEGAEGPRFVWRG
jgi:RimJ/RimL family protein N-acetyltransferase